MSKIDDFCAYLENEVKNHSLYCLGAQGESVMHTDFSFLTDNEKNARVAQILEKMANLIANGVDLSKARFFDCSGLGIYYFLEKGYVKYDMTADMIYRICTPITKAELRKGDFVFQIDGNGKMHHIGYCVGKDDYGDYRIIEAKGRSYGVVNSVYSEKTWSHQARPKFWETYSINRVLSYTEGKPLMTGDDVLEVQRKLTEKGYKPGTVDGKYGKNTASAVEEFQRKETKVLKTNYGKVNKNTALALGFLWKE